MDIRIKADGLITELAHDATTYVVYDKDLVEINRATSTNDAEKESMVITIDDSYKNTPLYGQIIYVLAGDDVTVGMTSLTNGEEDIMGYFPPSYSYEIESGDIKFIFNAPRKFISLIEDDLTLEVGIIDVVTGSYIYKHVGGKEFNVSLLELPKHTRLLDVKSRWLLGNTPVSNYSRKCISLDTNSITIDNTEYELNKMFNINVNIHSLGFIEPDEDTIIYAKVFAKDVMIHMLPSVTNKGSLRCNITVDLIDPYVSVKAIVGNTLIENKIKLTLKG